MSNFGGRGFLGEEGLWVGVRVEIRDISFLVLEIRDIFFHFLGFEIFFSRPPDFAKTLAH